MSTASLSAILLAFSVTGSRGLWSYGEGGVALGDTFTTPPDAEIVCDAGDGVVAIDGAGETTCDKTGCYAGAATLELAAGTAGDGVLVLAGGALGFSEVSGLGTEFVTAVVDGLGGQDFELFPEIASGFACGLITESPTDDVVSPRDVASLIANGHTIRSPRDSASLTLKVSDEGDGAGPLPFAYGVRAQSTGGDATANGYEAWEGTSMLSAVCVGWEGTSIVSAAVVALRNGDSLSDAPNRVSGGAVLGFMDYVDDDV